MMFKEVESDFFYNLLEIKYSVTLKLRLRKIVLVPFFLNYNITNYYK